MERYLVTGGAGFIGSNLVRSLLERGAEVAVLDDFSTGRRENLRDLEGRIRLVEGSLLDDAALKAAVAGADYVLHQAAIPSVQRSFENPLRSHRVNTEGSLRLLLAARDAGVRRVVMASSSSAYGDTPTLPKREDMVPAPISPYALTKLMGEHYGRVFTHSMGLEVVNLRYFNVFGPHQDPASHYAAVIPRFATRMMRGERPVIFGDGGQSRDFCFIDNVVSANLLACKAERAAGQVFNVAAGERTTLLQLVSMINELLGTSLPPLHEAARAGDVRHSLADVSKARDLMGYEVLVGFAAGLERTVRWYQQQAA